MNTRIEYCYSLGPQHWSNLISVSNGTRVTRHPRESEHTSVVHQTVYLSLYKEPLQVSGELTEDIEVYQSTPTYLHNLMTSDILRVLSEVLRELNGTSDFIAPRPHPTSPPDLFINQCPSSLSEYYDPRHLSTSDHALITILYPI